MRSTLNLLLVLAFLFSASPAQSAYLYKYVGANFSAFDRQNGPAPRHTRENRVTIELTINELLGPDVIDKFASVTYRISDGIVVYTNENSDYLYDEFFLKTDAQGRIVDWQMTVFQGDFVGVQGSRSQITSSGKVDLLSGVGGADTAEIYRCRTLACPNPTYTLGYNFSPGTWSVTGVATPMIPEPQTWLQLVIGFMVLSQARRNTVIAFRRLKKI